MKQINLIFCLALSLFGFAANAQHTEGGLPWSISSARGFIKNQSVPLKSLPAPDFEKAATEDKVPRLGPYRIGLMVNTDISLNNTGTFTYLDNGAIIWRAKISVPGAKATDLYYDRFNLPEGVTFFLSNANGKQIVGAFSHKNNNEDNVFTTTLIEGNEVNIEMNIEAGVSLSSILFHIDRVCANYRGGMVDNLAYLFGSPDDNPIFAKPTDFSDPCNINAACPEGVPYPELKQTAAHINMGGFVCSGNLINNTSQDCKPLFLTASHCDDGNGTTSAHFNQWKFYFNFEYATCTGSATAPGSPPPTNIMNDVLVGANFLSRSMMPPGDNPPLKGDFLLLRLKDPLNLLGNEYNAYLGGWDRTNALPAGATGVDFSHPVGDPKKVTLFSEISPNGNYKNAASGSHWATTYEKGGIEGGSSGSSLFDKSTGRILGDLTGGVTTVDPCDTSVHFGKVFSKIERNWEYLNGGDTTAATRLKDHLDPTGTNAMFTNTVKVAADGQVCGGGTSVKETEALANSFNVYPNPTSGLVRIKVNMSQATELKVNVVNILGVNCGQYQVGKMIQGNVVIDLNGYANGVYLININVGNSVVSKKVVLNR